MTAWLREHPGTRRTRVVAALVLGLVYGAALCVVLLVADAVVGRIGVKLTVAAVVAVLCVLRLVLWFRDHPPP